MDLKHLIPHQRRREFGPALDLQFATDKTLVPRVGTFISFSRASSGTFVNENGVIVGKTTSTTSINPASVAVGGLVVFDVPSGSLVGWLDGAIVSVMEDTDGDDQIGAQRHITGTIFSATDTQVTLIVTEKVGTTTLSNWFVSYRGGRMDHDPVTLVCKGQLMEDQRTNICRQSENALSWGMLNVTRTANVLTAPDGAVTADLIIEQPLTSSFYRVAPNSASITAGTTYVFSVFVKLYGPTGVRRLALSMTNGINAVSYFDLADGSIKLTSAGVATTTAYMDGWYRISVAANATATGFPSLNIALANTGNSTQYTSDGLSGFYVWGAQLEGGGSNVSSYTSTRAASAIRSADVCGIFGSNFTRIFSQIEGTLIVKAKYINTNFSGCVSLLSSNRSVCAINVFKSSATEVRAEVVQGPSYAAAATFNRTTAALAEFKCVIAFKQNDFASSTNGSAVQTDVSGVFPSLPLNQMTIGVNSSTGDGQRMFGHISSIQYYRQRLPNSSLQALSTI